MKYTNNFKLSKPELTDVIDIREINDNFEVIDLNLMAGLIHQELEASEIGETAITSIRARPPYIEIVNNNDFDVTVVDKNLTPEYDSYQFTIPAGDSHRINIESATYLMYFYVKDQHKVTFKWFIKSEEMIAELAARVAALEAAASSAE